MRQTVNRVVRLDRPTTGSVEPVVLKRSESNFPTPRYVSLTTERPTPIAWRVIWGRSVTTGFVTEVVEAYDSDEAMQEGLALHPELLRPNFAIPVDPNHKTYDARTYTFTHDEPF